MKKRMYGSVASLLLVLAMMLAVIGCGINKETPESQVATETVTTTETVVTTEGAATAEVTVLGEGTKKFAFTVVDKEGNEANFEIATDKETVGEALLELELIKGDEGAYGLYVKEVNGITADYDVDKTYWAFYVNGEYATAGVDATAIEEGVSYAFKVEK